MRLRQGAMCVALALVAVVPSGSAGAAPGLPTTGCERIALAPAPGLPELAVREAVQCAPPLRLGGMLLARPDGLWANMWNGALVRLDPRTFEVTATVDIPYVQGIVQRDDGVWALMQTSDAWFSGSALTHVDLATGAITTRPRHVTGGLTSNGTDLWAIGPVAITSPTPEGPWGLVTRIAPGSSEPAVGAIVPMKRRFESLGPIATVDGRTLFALRNRSFPTGGRATAQTIVRLTLAR